jgi:hypothetical protein
MLYIIEQARTPKLYKTTQRFTKRRFTVCNQKACFQVGYRSPAGGHLMRPDKSRIAPV